MNIKRALAGIILVAVVTLGACESAEMVEAGEINEDETKGANDG